MKTPLPASKNKPAQNNPYTETNRLSSRGSSLAFLTRANDEGSAFVFLECTLVLGGTTPQLASALSSRASHPAADEARNLQSPLSHSWNCRHTPVPHPLQRERRSRQRSQGWICRVSSPLLSRAQPTGCHHEEVRSRSSRERMTRDLRLHLVPVRRDPHPSFLGVGKSPGSRCVVIPRSTHLVVITRKFARVPHASE